MPSNQILHHPHSKQSNPPSPTFQAIKSIACIPSNQILHHPHSKQSNPSPAFQAIKLSIIHIPSNQIIHQPTFQVIKSSIIHIPSDQTVHHLHSKHWNPPPTAFQASHRQLHSKQSNHPSPTFQALKSTTNCIPSKQSSHHQLHSWISQQSNYPPPIFQVIKPFITTYIPNIWTTHCLSKQTGPPKHSRSQTFQATAFRSCL